MCTELLIGSFDQRQMDVNVRPVKKDRKLCDFTLSVREIRRSGPNQLLKGIFILVFFFYFFVVMVGCSAEGGYLHLALVVG